MAYKFQNGKIVNTKKTNVGSGNALAFVVDQETRHIYMIRYAVDNHGNMIEEDRTAFFQPAWLDMTKKQFDELCESAMNKANQVVKQYDHVHDVM